MPEREFLAGIPEIIKYGIIGNKNILNVLQNKQNQVLNRNINVLFNLCYLSLQTKIKFFLNDIFENNKRLSLNFGHTFAHAIEMAIEKKTKKDFIRHGEAVGIGMLCELYYEKKKKDKIFKIIENLLIKYNLPTKIILSKIPLKTNCMTPFIKIYS